MTGAARVRGGGEVEKEGCEPLHPHSNSNTVFKLKERLDKGLLLHKGSFGIAQIVMC